MIKRMKFKFTSLEDSSKADLLAAARDWRSLYLGLIALLYNGTFITFFLFTPLVIESLLKTVGVPEADSYIYSVGLSTVPAVLQVTFLFLMGAIIRAAPSEWRWSVGMVNLAVVIALYSVLPAAYNSLNFLLGLFTFSFLAGFTSPFNAILDTLPGLYLQRGGGSSSYFAVLNSFRNLSSVWTPAVIGYLIPAIGSAEAVTVVGLAYTAPVVFLFTGWFYLIRKDMPWT